MILTVVKIVISVALIVGISEISKRTGFWGELLASIPLVSVLAIMWIYLETQDVERIQGFSWSVFWLVIPSLSFFVLLPLCLARMPFWPSMALSLLATILSYAAMLYVLPKVGIKL